jgi:N-acetyl-gamma-glutamyl-phosphate/LysW-gamma-L-alpha-aminoadipyl-6-phosphate reductase
MAIVTRDAVVVGAGGFVGGELLRLVLGHPHLRLAAALSDSHAGRPIGEIHTQLAPFTDLTFRPADEWPALDLGSGEWTVFAALDHGASMARLPRLLDDATGMDVQLVDLSGDFRLHDPDSYEQFYGTRHTAPDRLASFVYGLPELHREDIRRATRIANPGCFATAASLALLPAAAAGWPVHGVAVDGMTGSSGAGVGPRPTTHHPLRANNLQAYKPLSHQHLPEIRQAWSAAGGDPVTGISFVPHMAPMVRGIAISAHLLLAEPLPESAVRRQYRSFYADAPFVRITASPPGVVDVWGSNRYHLCITARGAVVSVCGVLDNLVKGAAGQAVQNVNLMSGWQETTGLLAPVPCPV